VLLKVSQLLTADRSPMATVGEKYCLRLRRKAQGASIHEAQSEPRETTPGVEFLSVALCHAVTPSVRVWTVRSKAGQKKLTIQQRQGLIGERSESCFGRSSA
jgi:hypothetical protein